MQPRLFRIFYGIEFLVALLAIFTVWSQVGGQTHLDLMPWYVKFFLSFSAGAAIVKLTAAAVHNERAWTYMTFVWLLILLVIVLASGAVTYYYHLYEPTDSDDSGGTVVWRHVPDRTS